MESRVALLSIIVEAYDSALKINNVLHEYSEYIIARMGIPYRKKNVNIISIAVDAPLEIINALSGKIGQIENVNVKTTFSNIITKNEDKE